MPNLFAEFRRLIPAAPLLVGGVVEVVSGGALVQLPDGGLVRVRGAATVGQMVFIRDSMIEGPAPALGVVEIEV